MFRFLDQEIKLFGLTKNGWIICGFVFAGISIVIDVLYGLVFLAIVMGIGTVLSLFPKMVPTAFFLWPFIPPKRFGINVEDDGKMNLGKQGMTLTPKKRKGLL